MPFKKDNISFSSPKVKSEKQLLLLIKQLKKNGKTVGLCVGSYDLLHPGHIKHFDSAKKKCDILIVAVTSDKFVRKRKGQNRPIITEKLRAYSVAQLKSVDYVLISHYERAINLIRSLKPSYYIKGSDYKNKITPGITAEREAIKEAGGKIKYTFDEKFSTSELISKIRKKNKKAVLLIGGGIAGVGQTTLLKAFSKKNDFIYISKDVIAGSFLTTIKNGRVTNEDNLRSSHQYLLNIKYQTYLAMIKLAENNLNLGFNVVLDGYFQDKLTLPFIKKSLRHISKKYFVIKIYFTSPKKIVLNRVKKRNLDRDKEKLKDFDRYYDKHKNDDRSLFDIVFNTEGNISVNVDSLSHKIMNEIYGE